MAPAAAFPGRIGAVARYNGRQLATSAQWLARSREHTNYTYDLAPLNLSHLAWFVADVASTSVGQARAMIDEIGSNAELVGHLRAAAAGSPRRGLTDLDVRLGRRVGWYALVRLLKPDQVVETGTDKGLGTCVLAAAILANGTGRVTTVDINPDSGSLITAPYSDVVDRRLGDSVATIGELGDIDFFLHDSDHSPSHEAAELVAVAPHLSAKAVVLSDNAHATDELAQWAEAQGWRFAFFCERPTGHWYPGGGIGIATRPR